MMLSRSVGDTWLRKEDIDAGLSKRFSKHWASVDGMEVGRDERRNNEQSVAALSRAEPEAACRMRGGLEGATVDCSSARMEGRAGSILRSIDDINVAVTIRR